MASPSALSPSVILLTSKGAVQNRFLVEATTNTSSTNGFVANVRHPCRLYELRQLHWRRYPASSSDMRNAPPDSKTDVPSSKLSSPSRGARREELKGFKIGNLRPLIRRFTAELTPNKEEQGRRGKQAGKRIHKMYSVATKLNLMAIRSNGCRTIFQGYRARVPIFGMCHPKL